MYIESLKLINFRNYIEQKINFSKNINFIYGNNAQGKTNILESIYLCSVGKSHRYAKDIELVYFGEQHYYIEAALIRNNRNYKIEISFNNKKGKKIKAGGIELKKIGELLGKVVVVMFSPDDLKLVKDSPAYRRRFLDILICQLHASYLFNLQQYIKILEQRNNLLKQVKFKPEFESTIDVWDEKLEQVGSKIIKKRIEFIDKIAQTVKMVHSNITSYKENLEIIYKCNIIDENYGNISYEEIRDKFAKVLKKNKDIDFKRGFTSVGPHRDDFKLLINKLDVEKYGSQGQQRTVVLSLKLAELEILKEEIQENPILLLDDVFSELDENRRNFLKAYIKDLQVFITSTDNLWENPDNKDIKVLKVTNGSIYKD